MHAVHRTPGYRPDVITAYAHRKRIRVEPAPRTVRACLGQLILPQKDPDVLLVALLLQTLQKRMDADKAAFASIEQLPPLGRLQLGPRLVRIGANGLGEVQQNLSPLFVPGLGPGIDRSVGQALLGIADNQ